MTLAKTNLPEPDYDFRNIYIPRTEQEYNFKEKLKSWKPVDAPLSDGAPSPNNLIQGLVVQLYGRGGYGKSTLLIRFYDIATKEGLRFYTSKIIDWEFAVTNKRAVVNPAPGEEVKAGDYFELLCDKLAWAFDKDRSDFKEFKNALEAVRKAETKARKEVETLQRDDRYKWMHSVTADALLMAVKFSVPASTAVLNDKVNDKIKKYFGEAVDIGATQLAQLRARLEDKLKTEMGDYLDASLRMARGLGRDLAALARGRPLLIFFDTYEEIDEGDAYLRMVMKTAGTKVGWVMAGRDNLWAGVGQRERNPEVEYGYKDITAPQTRLQIDFSAKGDFTLAEIERYFNEELVKIKPGLPILSTDEAAKVLDITQGIPLAVRICAGLYFERPI